MMSRVQEIQSRQRVVLDSIYSVMSDTDAVALLNPSYDQTVYELLVLLGPYVNVGAIDQDMAEVFRNVYKSDTGFNPQSWSYAAAKKYLDRAA